MLTMANRTANVTAMNENQDTREAVVVAQDVDTHFNKASHAGLSALLNAVTLHISKSDRDQNDECERRHNRSIRSNHADDSPDSDECDHEKPPTTTTPTIVCELHESQRSTANTFPGILMTLLLDPDNSDILTFLPDGKYFALRSDGFAGKLMKERLNFNDYEAFVEELSTWGFCPVETNRPGIQVYRHRLFRKGDWKDCAQMKQGEHDTDPKESPSSLASRASLMEGVKRRLSPSSASHTNNGSSSKLRAYSSDEESSVSEDSKQKASVVHGYRSTRSTALAITTEKLNIRETDDRDFPLVQQAVIGATHTIVTDAIECLLRDEDHTKRTFEKHADELSKSSLPGLVPISKQLFSSVGEDTAVTNGINTADAKQNEEETESAEKSTGKRCDVSPAPSTTEDKICDTH